MNETTREADIALWLARTAEGDRAAFAALYRHSSPKLMGLVRRILSRNDLAEEALQEAYVRIWSNATQFDPALSRPMTWMAAIARNAAIDSRRRASERIAKESIPIDEIQLAAPAQAADLQSVELARLRRCLEALNAPARDMVLLAYHQGWSREELARKFDRPVATVKTILRRSLAALKECLDG
jgi:RNA polymerase sigma-70 factor (ECF subfamily)